MYYQPGRDLCKTLCMGAVIHQYGYNMAVNLQCLGALVHPKGIGDIVWVIERKLWANTDFYFLSSLVCKLVKNTPPSLNIQTAISFPK